MSSSDQWSYVLIIILLVPTTLADLERTCSSNIEHRGAHPEGVCGSQLSEILGIICVWGYNLPEKRGDERGNKLETMCSGRGEYDIPEKRVVSSTPCHDPGSNSQLYSKYCL